MFLSCLYQFEGVSDLARKGLRRLLKDLYFTRDKIAFFDIPALEIDRDVDGLMVIRGLTISLSSLTIIAHGIEVGIKLSDDMELALQVSLITIRLFRKIEIGDVYGNLKGGQYEMTFGDLAEDTKDADGDPLMMTNTPLLKAAAVGGDTSARPKMVKMKSVMTAHAVPEDASAKSVLRSIKQLSPDDKTADRQYRQTLDWIEETSSVQQSRASIHKMANELQSYNDDNVPNRKDIRAAICSQLHDKPSIPHPPPRSIRVTTLQNLTPPYVRKFLHRLPMLLRLLLNPISYFHPIFITSITAAASGKWIQHMLSENVFQSYGEQSAEIRRLEARINKWLADANFALELVNVAATTQVPLLKGYDVLNYLSFDDVLAYRTLPEELEMRQVVRLGGADARISVPLFLLPHHEHLVPPEPTAEDERILESQVDGADGKPKTVQAQQELEQTRKDETNVKISVHARLPWCLDQSLLDFVAALVKASKMVDLEKADDDTEQSDETESEDMLSRTDSLQRVDTNLSDDSGRSSPTKGKALRAFKNAVKTSMKEAGATMKEANAAIKSNNANIRASIRKVAVNAVANDRWIAKLVGKVTKKLETAQGEVGYSGNIPISLKPYRMNAETESKILP
ncbi:hypothetical protein LTR66_001688 [Elasticomyces elasticus]|nr:hypothetical protein LTR50_006598 [Elasticomyces elasticus]KAK4999234.1 hypothetical protein LTR66_001688 [Elasticomyces elasticus]